MDKCGLYLFKRINKVSRLVSVVVLNIFILVSCREGNQTNQETDVFLFNNAPIATNVSIVDDNGGYVMTGDTITARYTYSDLEGDLEGETRFIWMRQVDTALSGSVIIEETSGSYTLTEGDSGEFIYLIVVPVAITGNLENSYIPISIFNTPNIKVNGAPSVSSISITDNNKGDVEIGDILTGQYDYEDLDNDLEGGSTFRWLRNFSPIDGATEETYTLTSEDSGKYITFSVTPIATTGVKEGVSTISRYITIGTAPILEGVARYQDVNFNSTVDNGDTVILQFNQSVIVNSATENDLALPVSGDSLGVNPIINAGPEDNEVTVVLGISPSLVIYKDFNGQTLLGSPSGIEISNQLTPDSIEGANSGIDAKATNTIDIAPGFVVRQSLGSSTSSSIALGDLDADGDLDMVAANTDDPSFVYFNDGLGSYLKSDQALGQAIDWSFSIVLGDVDGDNDLDIVRANHSKGNQIYLNDGTGKFTDTGQLIGDSAGGSFALGDIDGDSDLDMVVSFVDGVDVSIYTNDGHGAYINSGRTVGAGAGIPSLGDVDGDGDLDMVVVYASTGGFRLYKNTGTGLFIDTSQKYSAYTNSIVFGDMDGDGDLDVIERNTSSGNRIYMNDGTGVFIEPIQSIDTPFFSHHHTVGDVDNDGDLDLLVVSGNFQKNKIYLNNGSGNLTDVNLFIGRDGNQFRVGDLDNDGDLDVVLGKRSSLSYSGSGGNLVYINSLPAK